MEKMKEIRRLKTRESIIEKLATNATRMKNINLSFNRFLFAFEVFGEIRFFTQFRFH
jgi:hypothetical protein